MTTTTLPEPTPETSPAPKWWHCDTHGPGNHTAWGCPECVRELRRWKSTHAPRLEALQGLLETEQLEASKGIEARASLASEREANAILTAEVDRLQNIEVAARDDERERCAMLLNVTRADVSLAAGEMSAQEWRTCAAVLRWMQGRIRDGSNVLKEPKA